MIEERRREHGVVDCDWLSELDETLREENCKNFTKKLNVRIELDYTDKWWRCSNLRPDWPCTYNKHLNRIGVSETAVVDGTGLQSTEKRRERGRDEDAVREQRKAVESTAESRRDY
ncbi:hypothetical protein L1887_61438 [Cichorium endivia]|nr:hypothetical protein L1887_61438 [Cichorium endivia]